MPFPSRIKELIQSLISGIKTVIIGFFRNMAEKAAQLRVRIQVILDRLLERIPAGKRRLVLMITAGVCAVLLIIIAGTSLLARGRSGEQRISSSGYGASSGRDAVQRAVIPPDELFLPAEPDFVPGVMLERDRRAAWTAEDAAPLWQDPLKNGEQEWRDRIEKTVDEILESVP